MKKNPPHHRLSSSIGSHLFQNAAILANLKVLKLPLTTRTGTPM